MKKASKKPSVDKLKIDLIEYAFTEWLVRQGIFTAYKSNYERAFSLSTGFRERLRGHIRRSLTSSGYGPCHLISSAFLFASTPEGIKFWMKKSIAWQVFCTELRSKL